VISIPTQISTMIGCDQAMALLLQFT